MALNVAPHSQQACDTCPIRPHAVCAGSPPDQLVVLEGLKFRRSFTAGQVVVWAGEEMDFVASVVSGVAELGRELEDGRRQMVGLLLTGDFLGRPGRAIAPYTVVAATDMTLCCFRRAQFEQLLTKMPALANRLLEMTLDELDVARDWMLLLGRKSARERIASLLVLLARRESAMIGQTPTDRIAIELPMTREAIADHLGLTLETVSRQLAALKADKVIVLDGKRRVTVPSFAALVAESAAA
ncbi:transcriptional regulator FnrL [Paracoccus sp. NGMCC 1.201697]|uniref:Transcriptional regulator FnrL n=1 Tax=Paracoccus broussonetiae subsp. drimophilus TaxID=3373869 RepID=A0ABW7LP26_9RHOB